MAMKSYQSDVFDIFSDPDQFPLVIFNVDERGPGVAFRDFDALPYADITSNQIDALLAKLAVSYISSIGQGHSYLEGVFDLPAGKLKNYRLILVSFYIGSESKNDGFNFNNYYQYGIFIPTPLSHYLPSFTLIEPFILNCVKTNLEGGFFLTVDKIKQTKREILAILTFVIYEKMKKCDC